MKYYIYLKDNEITGAGAARMLDIDVTNIEVSQEFYETFVQNSEKYIFSDGDFVVDPEYEAKQAAKEEERINSLTMTPLDFIGVLQNFGLSLEIINDYLENHLPIKMQLTYCQNVYCGVVKQLLPLTVGDVEITANMVEEAFILKNNS